MNFEGRYMNIYKQYMYIIVKTVGSCNLDKIISYQYLLQLKKLTLKIDHTMTSNSSSDIYLHNCHRQVVKGHGDDV